MQVGGRLIIGAGEDGTCIGGGGRKKYWFGSEKGKSRCGYKEGKVSVERMGLEDRW